jgi:hypothetical protein
MMNLNSVSFRRLDGILFLELFVTFLSIYLWLLLLFLQVELMRNLEDKDDEYKAMLNEKLQTADNSGLIQAYSKDLGNRLAN